MSSLFHGFHSFSFLQSTFKSGCVVARAVWLFVFLLRCVLREVVPAVLLYYRYQPSTIAARKTP